MDESTTVWLIRHGAPEGVDGRCYGREDVRLSLEGLRQAKAVAERLASQPISRVYSSRLSRAADTARVLAEAHGLDVHAIDDLAEMNFGDIEGLRYDDIRQRYPDVFHSWMTRPAETQFPNGENFTQFRMRVLAAMDALVARHHRQSIAVVAHAGVIRVMLGKALSIPDNYILRIAQDYGAINRIRYVDLVPTVELINGGTV